MAKQRSSYLIFLLIGFVFIGVVFSETRNISNIWDKKITGQRNINYQLTYASERWASLEDIRKIWPKIFKKESEDDNSLYTLLKSIDIGSSGLILKDRLNDASSSIIQSNGNNIGLSKTCVKNNSKGFSVVGKNIHNLISGVKDLESRHDISFSKVEIKNEKGVPLIVFKDFCFLMRIQ